MPRVLPCVGRAAPFLSLLLLIVTTSPDSAFAAENPGPASDIETAPSLESVVVTARRRAESLQDVPISITAVSSATLAQQNLSDLNDISAITPGLYDQQATAGRGDRSFEEIVIRGIADPFNPTVSVFLDGAPVPVQLVQNIGPEIERVEVLRGPQSAAFGQQTFAGAINYVTRDPGNDYHAYLDATIGNYSWDDIRASIEGPVIADKASLRVSARYYTINGEYPNLAEPGSRLGDQSTRSFNATLVLTPVDNLRVKTFVEYYHDNDGTGAYATFSQTPTNLFNCNAGAAPANVPNYICGVIPHYPASQIGLNSTPYPQFTTQVLQNSLGLLHPIIDTSLLDHGGLARDFLLGNVAIDWTIPRVGVLSSLTSVDSHEWQVIQDLDGRNTLSLPDTITPFPPTIQKPAYVNWLDIVQNHTDDWSEELRLTSASDQSLRWLIGGSFHNNDNRDYVAALIPFGLFEFVTGPLERTATTGVFGSVNYDFTPQLTATFDGRYQWLRLEEYNQNPATLLLGHTFPQFAPRVSLQYKSSPTLNSYLTYSRGYGTGTFNTSVLALPPAAQQTLFSQYAAAVIAQPSTLDNFEIGAKGSAFDRRLVFSADLFYDLWHHQLVSQSPVVIVGGVPDEVPVFSSIASSRVYGGELETQLRAAEHLSFNLNIGYADAKYTTNIPCPQCAAITGAAFAYSGESVPGASKINGTFGAQYGTPLVRDYEWFVRGDYSYRSAVFVDLVNVAKLPDVNKVNLRLGVNSPHLDAQLFVLNLFNDYAYNGVTSGSAPLGGNSITVGLPTMRQYGIKVRLKY